MRVEIERIQDIITRLHEGEAWHGPSIKEILDGVTAEQALFRLHPKLHNIAELVVHLHNWRVFVLEKLTGGDSYDIILNSSADWIRVETLTPEAWQEQLELLDDTHEELKDVLSRVSTQKLSDLVPGRKYKYHVLLYGLLQHDAYHAGQMAQLKKAQG